MPHILSATELALAALVFGFGTIFFLLQAWQSRPDQTKLIITCVTTFFFFASGLSYTVWLGLTRQSDTQAGNVLEVIMFTCLSAPLVC